VPSGNRDFGFIGPVWMVDRKGNSDAIFCIEYGRVIFVVGCIAKLCKNLLRQEAGMLWLLRKGEQKPA
jgi:hypothetical protein